MAAARIGRCVMYCQKQPTASRGSSTPGFRGQSAKCDRFATVLRPNFKTQILTCILSTTYAFHRVKRSISMPHLVRTNPNASERFYQGAESHSHGPEKTGQNRTFPDEKGRGLSASATERLCQDPCKESKTRQNETISRSRPISTSLYQVLTTIHRLAVSFFVVLLPNGTERIRTLLPRSGFPVFHSAFRTLHSALKNPSKTHPFPTRKKQSAIGIRQILPEFMQIE